MSKYQFNAKISVMKKSKFILSEGRVRLLKLVDKYGSISKAASEMHMSYRHAWGIIRKINDSLQEEAVISERGGESGGKTYVTTAGLELIRKYEERKKAAEIIMRFGPRPAVTVDGIIIKNKKILLIRRKNPPYKGTYALPGGFVKYKEPLEEAVVREIKEETGLVTDINRLIGVYSASDRDPRGHTISVAYELKILSGKVLAGSDAESAKWFSLGALPEIAFDHKDIIRDYLELVS